MFQICPKVPGQKLFNPPFIEEIHAFMSDLGYSGNIKTLSEVKVEILPQPWRTFGTIINKCLSGKVTGLDHLGLSRAQHEIVQNYSAVLPDNLTNQSMKESKAYKTYYDFATGKAIPKQKYVRRFVKEKNEQAPKASFSKRIKSDAKVTKSGKKKQMAEGLETLSEIAFGFSAHERTGVTPGVPDVPTYESDDEQISWKSRDDLDEEDTNVEDERDELYRDVNVNLEGRDIEMTDAQQTNVQTTQVGISNETSVARSPQQNSIVKRRNRTLIEVSRTMLIYEKAPLFLWAEAVATACYIQNRSIVPLRRDKTPYELLHDKPPDLSFFHVFGALCYPINNSKKLGKLQPKADIGIFIGYPPTKKAFWIYNRRTRRIIETIHVDFDELTVRTSEHNSLGPAFHEMTPATISSGLVSNTPPSTPFIPPSRTDWDILFQPLFDELLTLMSHKLYIVK
uniref:Retrovirus-related Pol polyprotein from transposon TNT 1-94 n=1 Tax=Tanacetum cinerariifolium TaxID=118510 RepID=A0A6L2N621_TANCI|nr:retrovirus-related Pol polyprotein from transposon TNT 1-94 [Tanacetum cinerariifolium]